METLYNNLLELSEGEYQDKITDFFQSLTTSKDFILLQDGKWDLKSKHSVKVVVDTATSAQARCHWCRNTLSVNQQIPNGAIPDVVLPFNLTKSEAKERKASIKTEILDKLAKMFDTETIVDISFGSITYQ